jgi:glycosyltransferase involved in cell wall biosynthesis
VENGADICLYIFKRLAPAYPNVSFDIAVRPHWAEIEGLDDAGREFENITIHRFPYEEGTTIDQLVAESICVFLPFRQLSVNPQLAILESMGAGRVVITTAIESNSEVVSDGTSYLIDLCDLESMEAAIVHCVNNVESTALLGQLAAERIEKTWSWRTYISKLLVDYSKAIERRE